MFVKILVFYVREKKDTLERSCVNAQIELVDALSAVTILMKIMKFSSYAVLQ